MLRNHWNILLDQLLNIAQVRHFLPVYERPSHTAIPRPTRSTNAMHIGFRNIWHFVIDHVRQLININTARCDVRSHQYTRFAVFEVGEGRLSGRLTLISMNGLRGDIQLHQVLHHLVGTVFGSCKHQHRWDILCRRIQQMTQQKALVLLIYIVNTLRYFLGRGRYRCHRNAHWIHQNILTQLHHLRGHRGREKEGLSLRRQFRNHLFHIVNETHIQHAIRLIQYKELNIAQVNVPLLHQIEESARRCCHHIHTALDGIHLRLLSHTPKNHGVFQAHIGRVRRNTFVDLQRQFPRGSKYKGFDTFTATCIAHQLLDDRNGESRRFAGSCLCRA